MRVHVGYLTLDSSRNVILFMNRQRRRMTPPLLAMMLAISAGCGQSDRAEVHGRVARSDGSPLVGATVTARSETTGKWGRGVTDADGRFQLGGTSAGDGIAPGEYYVTIVEDRGDMDQLPATIPARFGRPTQSGISLTVRAGDSKELNVTIDPT